MYSYNAYDTYLHVYLCTYALLSQIYNPRSREYIGTADVTRQVGLPPDQLRDYWALTGDTVVGADAVLTLLTIPLLYECDVYDVYYKWCMMLIFVYIQDNIPGVAGVGPKAALALIKHFGSLEALIAELGLDGKGNVTPEKQLQLVTTALSSVRSSKEKILKSLIASGGELMLYKSLVTLKEDVPLEPPVGLGFEGYSEHIERMDMIKATATEGNSVTAAIFPVLSVDDLSITTTTTTTPPLTPSPVSPYLSGLTTRHFRFIGQMYYTLPSHTHRAHT